jgi:hypothetical protein
MLQKGRNIMAQTPDLEPGAAQALTVAASQEVIPQAVDAEPWDADMPRVLLCGVDSLYLSFDLPVSEEVWARLDHEQQLAKQVFEERRAVHCPAWLNAILRPTGAKGGYRFLIESDAWSIKLLRDVPNRPPIFVELRAFALHTHPEGVLGLCQEVCTYLQDVLLEDQDPHTVSQAINVDVARCSRLDLHCDWQGGWHPTLAEGEQRLFLRPGQVDWHPYLSGNTCTGYVFGKGHVLARIYHKTRQAQHSHLDWYFTLLEQRNGADFHPVLDVWRLEFQLTRAGVKGFRLATTPEFTDPDEVIAAELEAEDLPSIGTVRKALHWAGQVWRYLTTRWLRLVTPDDHDTNRARWPVHPTWAALREGFAPATARSPLPPGKLHLVRAERYSGYQRLLDRMAVGVLTAVNLYDSDPGAVAGSWLAAMHRLAQAIRRKQVERLAAWEAHGQRARADAGRRGMGASLDHLRKVEQLLAMALGVFTSIGVVSSELPYVASVADLLGTLVDDLEAVAVAKGGIGQLLHDKRCQVYKAAAPRGLFTPRSRQAA